MYSDASITLNSPMYLRRESTVASVARVGQRIAIDVGAHHNPSPQSSRENFSYADFAMPPDIQVQRHLETLLS